MRINGVNAHEVVPRPDQDPKGRAAVWPYDAIAETAITGKAVRIDLNGTSASAARSSIHQAMMRRGLKGHTKVTGGDLIAWASKA